MTVRYALYFLPPADHAVYQFGAELLGYDSFSGRECEHPADACAVFADWHAITSEPRKYGFHATLKAPFPLAAESSEADLAEAFDRFVDSRRSIPAITPVVRAIGSFVAIVPQEAEVSLAELADDCVRAFDPLRRPLTSEERERRLKSPLTPRQADHLERWGYPYVFDQFRFHMTLTGPLAADRSKPVQAFLQDRLAALGCHRLAINALALLRQENESSRFVVAKYKELQPK